MTEAAIQKQIEVIKQINSKARTSKESAKNFLIEVGIIDKKADKTKESNKKNK